MVGAIIGDIAGSIYEYEPIKNKNFNLFDGDANITDDSIMTMAVFCALEKCNGNYNDLSKKTAIEFIKWFKKYPNPKGAYGSSFATWCEKSLEQNKIRPAYNSFGNGAAMRVSPVAYFAKSIEHCKQLSKKVTIITHNHEEGLKGAEATAVATYMALNGFNRQDIFKYIQTNYYPLDESCNEIRKTYEFNSTCQGTVPESLQAFFESTSFEDAIKITISMGGDSDTMGAITGAFAEAYFGVKDDLVNDVYLYLDNIQATVFKRMISKRDSVVKRYLESDGEIIKQDFFFSRGCGADMDGLPEDTINRLGFTYKDEEYKIDKDNRKLLVINNENARVMTISEFQFFIDEIRLFLSRRYHNKPNIVENSYKKSFLELSNIYWGN